MEEAFTDRVVPFSAATGGSTDCSTRKSLTITSTIRIGRDRGAQLVAVKRTMVAKIYDPFYYTHINEYDYKEDVVGDADGDYCR
jgi:hypothetical protein